MSKTSLKDTFDLETKKLDIYIASIFIPNITYTIICFLEKNTGDVFLHYKDTELNGLIIFYDLVKQKVAEEVVSSI